MISSSSFVAPQLSVPLTPRQQQFRDDPERCRMALQNRADRLFEDGYRAFAAAMPQVFLVVLPESPQREEARYYVHAIKQTCSCAFFTRQHVEPLTQDGSIVLCKHLLGLEKLVKRSAYRCKNTGDLYPFFRLLGQWMGVVAEQFRTSTLSAPSTDGVDNPTSWVDPVTLVDGVQQDLQTGGLM